MERRGEARGRRQRMTELRRGEGTAGSVAPRDSWPSNGCTCSNAIGRLFACRGAAVVVARCVAVDRRAWGMSGRADDGGIRGLGTLLPVRLAVAQAVETAAAGGGGARSVLVVGAVRGVVGTLDQRPANETGPKGSRTDYWTAARVRTTSTAMNRGDCWADPSAVKCFSPSRGQGTKEGIRRNNNRVQIEGWRGMSRMTDGPSWGSLDGEREARAFALVEHGRNARREAGCRGGRGNLGEGRARERPKSRP